jgi:hypothetical protein
LFLCLASSNISKGQFQKEAYHLLFPFPFATALQNLLRAAQSTSPRKGFCHAVDFIVQWISSRSGCHAQWDGMLSRSGFHRAVDVVTHGFCRAVDFIAQWISSRMGCCRTWMLSRSGFHRAVDFVAVDVVAQWMLSRMSVDFVTVDFITHGCCHDGLSHRDVSHRGFSCAQATGRTAQMTGLVVNFKITF